MNKIDYSIFKFPKTPNIKKEPEKTSQATYDEVKGRGRGLTDNPQNCIMLCDDCHDNVVHKNQKKYRPILIKIREKLNSK